MVQVKVGMLELEAPQIAGAVGMRPKNQKVYNYRQSDLDGIVLGVFYEFK